MAGKKNILLLTVLSTDGGISSWSHKFISSFGKDEYNIIPIDRTVKGRNFYDNALWSRITAGIREFFVIRKKLKDAIRSNHIDILHTTTSGSLGTFRDYCVAKICRHAGIPTVMHCRYGCISEDISHWKTGWFLRKTMSLYDQIWVLDSRSLATLEKVKALKWKVYLTPNSITVKPELQIPPKDYRHVAFIGNLIPDKGLFELVEAICRITDKTVKLSIVGSGDEKTIERIKQLAGDDIGRRIFIFGRLPNAEAVEFMKSVDIIALPTYYKWEAFPISILEAMSLGKLVISTPRAAIKDMLTSLDGGRCGILVKEKSVEDIVNAITWCVNNSREADTLCRKAYEKVYNTYRTDVIYTLYDKLYKKVIK